MGIISVEKANHLLWLGRYIERVHSTIKKLCSEYDNILESNDDLYKDYCKSIDIPDVYGSKEVFLDYYIFNEEDENSITSNLGRAYDNAVVMREEIGSETLSYIQLAVYDMDKSRTAQSTIVELQNIIDHILAFWGCVDDMIEEETIKSILKTGRRIERLDLYLRFGMSTDVLKRELNKLSRRIDNTGMSYNMTALENLPYMFNQDVIDYKTAVEMVENIIT